MSHTEDKKSGCTEGETYSETNAMHLSDKRNAGIHLEIQNGDFIFGINGQTWISGPGNIPEISGKVRTEPAVGTRMRLEAERETVSAVMEYRGGAGEKTEIRRTLECCPISGSFTVQDEPVKGLENDCITEVLRFVQPVRILDGMAVTEMEGRRVTVFVRNQENLRVEREQMPGELQRKNCYCLKWEMKKGCAYTCCQVEIQEM